MFDKRNKEETQKTNKRNWDRFVAYCRSNAEYEDPSCARFPLLPQAIVCYVSGLMQGQDGCIEVSINPAEKARGGISDYYKSHPDALGT